MKACSCLVAVVLLSCQAFAQEKSKSKYLTMSNLKVGTVGKPTQIKAKVRQVLDENSMTVGIENEFGGDGRYSTLVLVKCSTDGITDGKTFEPDEWKAVTGIAVFEVTGTKRLKLTSGGTKTVFVLEAFAPKRAEEPKPIGAVVAGVNFVGKWKILGEDGEVSTFFTLTKTDAKKSHAPDVTGKWEVVKGEARITWSDGWKDALRPTKEGVIKMAFGPGLDWDAKPSNTGKAIKQRDARPKR